VPKIKDEELAVQAQMRHSREVSEPDTAVDDRRRCKKPQRGVAVRTSSRPKYLSEQIPDPLLSGIIKNIAKLKQHNEAWFVKYAFSPQDDLTFGFLFVLFRYFATSHER